jgi:N-acetyl-alpha-D-muramate 1-phosphate uridylyltransferase
MTPQSVMIFAAGLGTRMGALTRDRPKPLIPVGGRPLIDHAIDLAQGLRIVVNVHYRADMMRRHLQGRDVAISEEPVLLETGGGLRQALPLLGDGPVFTLNSDAIWQGPNPLEVLADHWGPDMEALLLLLPRHNVMGHPGKGDFIPDTTGRLHRGAGLIYSGAQIIRTDALAEIPDPVFSLNDLWDRMAERGTLYGVEWIGRWCDVGQPQSLNLAEALLKGQDVSTD